MSALTKNLPGPIRDLGVSLLGQKCYTSLVEELDVQNVECLKYALSKALGLGIVLGGSVMKLPQLIIVLRSQYARGLSLSSYVLETLGYAITVAYSYKHDFPFSTYGENVFLALQNTAILLLIIALTPTRHQEDVATRLVAAAIASAGTGYLLSTFPPDKLAFFQLCTLPLSVLSKIPQIRENAHARSTGQLSTVAVVAQIAGCLARLFTTFTEVGDTVMAAGFALALLLNLVLGAQVWMYRGRAPTVKLKDEPIPIPAELVRDEKASGSILSEKGTGQVQWGAQAPGAVPARRAGTPQPSGRKWARKVD